MGMRYVILDDDIKNAEIAAYKIAPLFRQFGWKWSEGLPYSQNRRSYTPTVQQIADAFVEMIEEWGNSHSLDFCLESGRLGIKSNEDGYQLYLTL